MYNIYSYKIINSSITHRLYIYILHPQMHFYPIFDIIRIQNYSE